MAIPNFDVEFTKDGAVFDAGAGRRARRRVSRPSAISSSWRTDGTTTRPTPRELYDELLGNIDKLLELRTSQRCRDLSRSSPTV